MSLAPPSSDISAAHTDTGETAGAPTAGATPTDVRFEPLPLRHWIQGWLPADPLVTEGGWALDDAHRFGPWEVVLRWTRSDGADRRVSLRLRNPALPAAASSEQFDVLYKTSDGDTGAFAQRLADALSRHESRVHFRGAIAEASHRSAPQGPPPAFNLAVPGNCRQKCSFCGIRETVKVANDPGDPFVAQLSQDIAAAAQAGTRVLRVNGIEPLAAPYIWDLLGQARDAGFSEFHVLSTFRPIDSPQKARRLLDAMPQRYRFYLPLYGSRAEVHDTATGAPGSFEQTMRSAHLLRDEMVKRQELDGRGQLLVTTVLMRQNLADMHAMAMLVGPLARTWEIHLAFPNTGSRYDPYPTIAVSMTEALEALAPDDAWAAGELPIGEVTPCVAFRHQRRTGHPLVSEDRIARRRQEPSGTYYESAGFSHSLADGKEVAFTAATVPCPHVSECALAQWCPQKVYAAYAAVFGLQELVPITEEQWAGRDVGAASP